MCVQFLKFAELTEGSGLPPATFVTLYFPIESKHIRLIDELSLSAIYNTGSNPKDPYPVRDNGLDIQSPEGCANDARCPL